MKAKGKGAFDPRTLLAALPDGRTTKEYRKSEVVFSQGDPAEAVFFVERGKVKLTVLSKQGKQAVIAILGAGDFFGEGCLAGQPLRMATVTTMSESSIVRLDKVDTVRVLHNEPAFSEMFLHYLLSRNIRIEEDL